MKGVWVSVEIFVFFIILRSHQYVDRHLAQAATCVNIFSHAALALDLILASLNASFRWLASLSQTMPVFGDQALSCFSQGMLNSAVVVLHTVSPVCCSLLLKLYNTL